MEITTAILTGIIANIATTAGKATLAKISGNSTITDNIEAAFDRALKKWSPNKEIRNRESIYLANRTKLLNQIVLQCKTTHPIDKITEELLTLFKIELMSDPVAYHFIDDIYWQDSIKRSVGIERKIDNIQNLFEDFTKEHNTKKELLSTEILPIKTEQISTIFPNNFFIDNITKEHFYIPRNLISHLNINKETSLFESSSENEILELSNLIINKSKIVVLGSAGMGKSVELREASIAIASKGTYFPIFIPLNTYTSDSKIDEILPLEWKSIPVNRIILLLDGLDEIEPSQIHTAKRKIAQFTSKYPRVRLVISCRTNFYDLPTNKKVGTLRDFEVFYIQELTVKDIVDYVTNNHNCNGQDFINEVYQNNFSDLVFNPFFLKLLIRNYITNNFHLSRNRVQIFREFINSRLELDESHYSETINIKDEKFKALKLLRKISLAMEVIGVRVIDERGLRELISKTKDFQLITYCTVFKKEEGTSDKWKFEHNYFQEFLCAELLSEQSFDTVKSFICYKDYEKVLPNWFNTVAQLISILDVNNDLFIKLTKWLIKNDTEVLVNVEREKLSIEIREEIFKQIFNYYKDLKIWIDSNKFNDKDLAYFGQSNDIIKFVLNEATERTNHRAVRLCSLRILGGFELENHPNRDAINDSLIKLLIEKNLDSYFVFSIINSIHDCKFYDKETIDRIFQMVGQKKSQYVRAAMYKLLANSDVFENYVDYFIEGIGLLRKGGPGRESINLADEDWNLKAGIKSFKSPQALIKILNFLVVESEYYHDHDANETLRSIIKNSTNAYKKQPEIFSYVYGLMKYHSKYWTNRQPEIVISFFLETGTKLKAFNEVLSSICMDKDNFETIMLLSYLSDDSNFHLIINAYNSGNINSELLLKIFRDINYINQPLSDKYISLVHKKTNVKIEIPERIDWDTIRKVKSQKSFDLLFDYSEFQNECMRIFEKKEELSSEELFGFTKKARREIEFDDIYIESALRLIRDFARDAPTTKTDVSNWLKNTKNYEGYMIAESCQYIKGHDGLIVRGQHIDRLKEWFDKYIYIIDFTKAITKGEGDTFSINNYARFLTFLIKKYDFKCSEKILLDMLLFAFGNVIGAESILFEDILKKIEDEDIFKKRIVENINKNVIFDFSIYKNHVNYAFENKLIDSYQTIFDNLIESNFKDYQKNEIINLYIDSGNNIEKLKEIFDNLNIEVKFNFIQRLIVRGDIDFVIGKLLELHKTEINEDYLRNINNYLIKSEEIKGLNYSIEWIKRNKRNPFSQHGQGLAHFDNIQALPHLLTLLELSYDDSILSDHELDRMYGIVLNGIENLALSSKENYKTVTTSLKCFIENNIGKLKDVEFINRSIEGMKEKFYKNETIKYDLSAAKNKIIQLGLN